jgi:hypothetical protein
MRALVAAAAAVLALAGCSSGPGQGVVMDAKYRAGYTYFISCGKTMCPAYNGPSWSLDLYADNGEHGWQSVDETTFHRCPVGTRFPECAS